MIMKTEEDRDHDCDNDPEVDDHDTENANKD